MTRKLRRFFTDSPLKPGGTVTLSREETSHLQKTLRLGPGDSCLVTDGQGAEARAIVASLSGGQAVLRLEDVSRPEAKKRPVIRLYPAYIHRGKMDDMVEKAQELEADSFVPVETEWTTIKLSAADAEKVSARWKKLVCEAAKQSGALRLMQIEKPVKYAQALAAEDGAAVMFHPGEGSVEFAGWIKTVTPDSRLKLFFGPEGGFTDEEAAAFKGVKVRLTDSLLKADTAVLGVLSALRFLFP